MKLEQTEAQILVCIPETAKLALEGHELIGDESIKKRTQLVCLGQNQHDIVNLLPWVLEKSSEDGSSILPYIADNPKNELAFITWSSGTTGINLRHSPKYSTWSWNIFFYLGTPKGICHSHYSMLNYLSSFLFIIADGSPMLMDLTIQHVGNAGILYQSLLCKSTLYHCYGIDGSQCTPEEIFRAIVKYQPRVVDTFACFGTNLLEQ